VGFVVDKVTLGQVFFEYFGSSHAKHPTDCSTLIVESVPFHPEEGKK
jgi:hypothetical protein